MFLTISTSANENLFGRNVRLHDHGYIFCSSIYSMYGALSEEKLSCGMSVGHANIGLYYFTPTDSSFNGIAAGATIRCIYHNKLWTAARTDHLPNWYVASLGMKPHVIESTISEDLTYVGAFDTPSKWKRTEEDQYNPVNATVRYNLYHRISSNSRSYKVIPSPLKMEVSEGSPVQFDRNSWAVTSDFPHEEQFLIGK